jgi:hypothetical protein
MKNNYLKTVLLLLSTSIANIATSQNLVSSWYTFTTSTSTYSAISSGSVLGSNANDDDIFDAVPIGFTFNFMGNNYTNVSVSSNGYLKLGSVLTNFAYSPIEDGFGDDSLVCAVAADLEAISTGTATGVLSYTTLGISPNRTFVVQWERYTSYSNTDNINFQIRLYETTNRIETIYGGFTLSTAFTCQVGLRGNSSSDFNNRSVVNGTNTWTTSVAGLNNFDFCDLDNGPPVFRPASGRKYTWNPPPPCSGTPVAGTLTSLTGTIACIGQALDLNVTGSTLANGLSYQWQASANGSTWTSVSSATNAAYAPTYTAAPIYYRRVTACGSSTAASAALNFTTIAGITYTTVPFLENFNATWQNRCGLRNVPRSTCWSSNPTTGNSSWRRDDDGVSANWTNLGNGQTPLQGNGCADFNSDDATPGVSGALDLYVNMGTTQNYNVSFYYVNDFGNDSLEVFLSTNGGGTFVKQATYQSADFAPFLNGWNKKTISLLSVNSPSCVVRFQATSNFDFEHIAIDSLRIALQPTCAGTPSAGTISSPIGTVVCLGQSLNLPVSGGTSGFSGLTYQWQASANGSTWTAVASATNPAYTPIYTASPIYYRRVIACGSNTAASNSLNFSTAASITYTSVPYLENFNATWQNRCDLRNVPRSACWSSSPTTGNNSWRRDDDGVSANWTNLGNGQTPLQGNGCADFNSNDATPGVSGKLDLYVNMGTTQNYDVSFYYFNDFGDDSLEVLLSTNGGGTFVKQANYKSGDYDPFLTDWNKNTISLFSVNSPSCVLRFQATSNNAFEHIAIDSLRIVVQPTCTGTPSAATISSPLGSTICLGQTLTFSVTGGTSGFSGLTYQWQGSTNGTTWTAIPTATTPGYSLTYTTPLFYRRVIACGVNSATTNALSFTTTIPISYAPVPFLENFNGNWQNRCDSRNVPTTAFWSSNPTRSDSSWRRQDDGISANWTSLTSGTVAPLTGAGCANFHSYYADQGTSGSLDLYINMGTPQNYEVAFYHTNDSGDDSLEVFLSTNGGGTFTKRGVYFSGDVNSIESAWNKKVINLTAINSPSCVLRFKATSDFGNSDIGVDSLKVRAFAAPCTTPTLALSASSNSVCTGSSSSLTVSGASSYTWSTAATTSVIVVSPTVASIYTVTGSNGAGCNSTTTIQITVNSSPTIAASNATICSSSSTIITASGATSYTWSTGATSTSVSLNPLTNTNYTVTGANASGCTNTRTISVTVNTTPTITASNATICLGSSTVVTASGASGYLWNTGIATASISLSPTVTTNYTVSGNSALGCIGTRTIQVSVVSGPTLSAANRTICVGSSTVLTASGATSYTWNTGATTASISVSPAVTTIYTVSGSNAAGCVGTRTVQVTANPIPTVSVNNQTICPGGTATITASGATTYSWSTGSTASSITVAPSVNTNYTVTGNSLGCVNTRTASVTVGSALSINISSNPVSFCLGNTGTLSASGAITYTWNTGFVGTNLVITPTTTTNYTVNGTNGACSGTKTISIIVNSNPTVTATASSSNICVGATTSLTASGAVTYTWNPGSFVGSVYSISPTIATNYTVTGANASGCVNTRTIQVSVSSSPTISAANRTVCAGTSTVLTASGATSYTWNTGATTSSISVSPTVTTIYTVTGSNASGCSNTRTVSVTVNNAPTIIVSANPTTICSGESSTLTAIGAISYIWSAGGSGANITVTPLSTTIYTVSGTSSGCVGNTTVAVNVNPTPTVSVNDQTICPGGTATITAGGASTYLWDNGSTSASIVDSPSANTSYTVTGTSLGCSDTKTVSVIIGGFISLNITPSPANVCAGGSVTLVASGASSYTWSTGSISSAINLTPSITADYTVNGSNGSCTGSQTVTVFVNPNPTLVTTASSSTICVGNTTSLSVSGANSYTWNPGNFVGASNTVNPSSTTTYTVVGADINGCLDTKFNVVTVDQLPSSSVAGPSQTLCTTSATLNGNVQTSGSGVWSLVSGAGTITSPNQANSTVTGLNVGNNTFQWTISNGVCPPSSSTVSIVGNTSPTITASSDASVICEGSTATLTAIGATTYSWNTGDLTASIVVSPSVTTTYSVIGDFGLICPSSAIVIQLVDPCLSINGIGSSSYNIAVYPNPFNDDLTISTNEAINVQFFNTLGQLVIEKNIDKTDVINTQGFAKGIYHVVTTGTSSTKTFKVVKQ